MEIQKYQYAQTFLSIVKASKSKNDFFKIVQEFDQKFTETFNTTNMNNKMSLQSFPSASQIDHYHDKSTNQFNQINNKLKNPFLKDLNNNNQDIQIKNYSPKNRMNNFISPVDHKTNLYNQYNNNQNSIRLDHGKKMQINNWNNKNNPIEYSRSQQQFYKHQNPSNTYQGGFNQKPYQKNIYPPSKFNNQWNQDLISQYQGQQVHPYNNKNPQFDQLARNFQNMNLKDQHNISIPNNKLNSNEILSFANQHPYALNNLDNQTNNQFLTNLQKQTQPDFVKYYKKYVPSTQSNNNLHKQNKGPIFIGDNRLNPFANKN